MPRGSTIPSASAASASECGKPVMTTTAAGMTAAAYNASNPRSDASEPIRARRLPLDRDVRAKPAHNVGAD